MEIKLVVLGGAHAGKEIRVRRARFIIGRSKECQLRPGCNLVSRRHCAIVHDDGRLIIEDLGSTNGTFVNDEKVEAPRELKQADRLGVGTMEFEVRLFENVESEREPEERNDTMAAEKTVAGRSREMAAREKAAIKETKVADKKIADKKQDDRQEPLRQESGNGEAPADANLTTELPAGRGAAPITAENSDLDITNWLDDALADFSSAGDGNPVSASDSTLPDTAEMLSSVGKNDADEEDADDEDADEEEERVAVKKDNKKESNPRAANGAAANGAAANGKPPSPPPAAKKIDSSRNAAGDVLNQMYRFMK
jgi:pSer/pThr/pTyr-binding forkhead associated (FHA) protein